MTSSRRVLLACGIAASVVYAVAEIVASVRYDGYSWVDYTVSELFAVGAPTRTLILVAFSIHNVLLFTFAIGVWLAAGDSKAQRVIAVTLAASALLGVGVDYLAPIHPRGTPQGTAGAWHAGLTGVQVALILTMVACGTRVLERSFRRFSWAMLSVLLVVGTLTGFLTGDLETGEATPWLGFAERVLIYTYLLWVGVLAVGLLRRSEPRRD